jgi:hypothetical protein
MKRTLLIAAVAGLAMTMSSCKKEYTCECTVTTYSQGQSTTTTATSTSGKMKKADADTWCNNGDSSTGDNQNGIKSDCNIK